MTQFNITLTEEHLHGLFVSNGGLEYEEKNKYNLIGHQLLYFFLQANLLMVAGMHMIFG
ncbi:MAG: hypothetical protein ACOX5W_13545 [Bacillota bacterium]|jgi:hypothetical protein